VSAEDHSQELGFRTRQGKDLLADIKIDGDHDRKKEGKVGDIGEKLEIKNENA